MHYFTEFEPNYGKQYTGINPFNPCIIDLFRSNDCVADTRILWKEKLAKEQALCIERALDYIPQGPLRAELTRKERRHRIGVLDAHGAADGENYWYVDTSNWHSAQEWIKEHDSGLYDVLIILVCNQPKATPLHSQRTPLVYPLGMTDIPPWTTIEVFMPEKELVL